MAAVAAMVGMASVDARGQNVLVVNYGGSTVASVAPDGTNTTFVSTGLNHPWGGVYDVSGNLFITNNFGGTITKVTPDGNTSTFVGSGLSWPTDIVIDGNGTFYVANSGNGQVVKVGPTGNVSSFVNGAFSQAQGLAFTASGNLLVVAANGGASGAGGLYSVTPAGAVTQVAGGFTDPRGVAIDASGNYYVTNYGNGTVAKVTTDGNVSIIATGMSQPFELLFDASGNLLVTNQANGTIASIAPDLTVTTLATGLNGPAGMLFAQGPGGGNTSGGNTSAPTAPAITVQPTGAALTAGANATFSVTATGDGLSYQWTFNGYPLKDAGGISGTQTATLQVNNVNGLDNGAFAVTVTNAGGAVTSDNATLTVDTSGLAPQNYLLISYGNGSIATWTEGSATTAPLYAGLDHPWGGVYDPSGNLYVTNNFGGSITKLSTDGNVTTLAAGLSWPTGIAMDASGTLYVAYSGDGRVVKVSPSGNVTNFVSGAFSQTQAVQFDTSGNLIVVAANGGSPGAGGLYSVTPAGAVKKLAGGFTDPRGLAMDLSGNYYVSNYGNGTVAKVSPSGNVSIIATGLNQPFELLFDPAGNLLVPNQANGTVSVISPTGTVTTVLTGLSGPAEFLYAQSALPGNVTSGGGNTSGGNTSEAVPVIGTQPVDAATAAGENATFTVSATGDDLSYQWTFNGHPLNDAGGISGTHSATLQINGTTGLDNGVFAAVVSNFGGAVTSGNATLTVDTSGVGPQSYLLVSYGDGTVSGWTEGSPPVPVYSGLDHPWGGVFDASGNLYVTNNFGGSITKFGVDGNVTTLVTGMSYPTGIAMDASGTLYVGYSGDGDIVKVSPSGSVSPLVSGAFSQAQSVEFDSSGNLIVVAANGGAAGAGGLYSVTPAGVVSQIASGFTDPRGLAMDLGGNYYVSNYGNGTVAKVTPGGNVSIIATGLSQPFELVFDVAGNLLVPNQANGTISMIAPDGGVSTLATGLNGPAGLVPLALTGAAPTITTQPAPLEVAAGGNATFTVAATGTGLHYQWTLNGRPLADSAGISGTHSATLQISGANIFSNGSYAVTIFNQGGGVVSDGATLTVDSAVLPADDMLVINYGDGTINKLTAAGGASTVLSGLDHPWGGVFDTAGDLLVTNNFGGSITKIGADGSVSTLATGLNYPTGIAMDANGTMYVAYSGDGEVVKVSPAGQVSRFVTDAFSQAQAVEFDASGNLIVVAANGGAPGAGGLYSVTPDGTVTQIASGFTNPRGVAMDGLGDYFVTNYGNGTVAEVSPEGDVTTIARGLAQPFEMQFDSNGNLLVTNQADGTIASIAPDDTVTTLVTGLGGPAGLLLIAANDTAQSSAVVAQTQAVLATAGGNVKFGMALYKTGGNAFTVSLMQPAKASVVAGRSATFGVAAGNTSGLAFQWQLNGKNIRGATKPTYTIPRMSSSTAGKYTVVVIGPGGTTVVSSAMTVSLLAKPAIVKQPSNASASKGGSANFNVTASGGQLSYQWLHNGKKVTNGAGVTGATSTQLNLSSVNAASAGQYQVVVSNVGGKVTSSAVRLKLK